MNPDREKLRDATMPNSVITDPINSRHNPAERGATTPCSVKWPAELLTADERRRETKIVVYYFLLFSLASQFAAGTIPLLDQYRVVTLGIAYVMWMGCFSKVPLLFHACIGVTPFCLVPPHYTAFFILRTAVCLVMPLYTAYFFRQHLIGLVTSAPLPKAQADDYVRTGKLPKGIALPPLMYGMWKGFVLGVQSWFTYLGNEQRLPSVYSSPAGVWHSRTFATALGLFGMVIMWPRDLVLVISIHLLALIHPIAVLAMFLITIIGPIISLGVLMFLVSANRLRSALALQQYATLENTFSDLVPDLSTQGPNHA